MSNEKKYFANFRRAVAWTAVYVFVMWLILGGLFNFNMFSLAHWTKLLHLQLHGFAGFVFGILILAAVPLYVATTMLTVRNKEMPVKIPLPKCFTEEAPKPKPEPVVPVVVPQEPLPELRSGVPAEMRETFMRAQRNYGARQMSVFNRPDAATKLKDEKPAEIAPVIESVSNEKVTDVPAYGGMPIPTDFDMDAPVPDSDVPVFADINFDDDKTNVVTDAETPKEKPSVYDALRAAGIDANMDGDLIVANGFAVAVHDDDDFWVADEIDWFAAGKQKPSPIAELKKAQSEKNLKPVLYLATDSIMDIDKVSAEWIADGITVVKTEKDLLGLVESC